MVSFLKEQQAENPVPESDLIACIWQGLMSTVDWGTRPDQIEGLALREVGKYAAVLEPFCNGPKTEVALINTVQIFCYEESRVMKVFPQILKVAIKEEKSSDAYLAFQVLYNKDCISDQAILYWHSKGSKPQGRQHFLTVTQPLVNVRTINYPVTPTNRIISFLTNKKIATKRSRNEIMDYSFSVEFVRIRTLLLHQIMFFKQHVM